MKFEIKVGVEVVRAEDLCSDEALGEREMEGDQVVKRGE